MKVRAVTKTGWALLLACAALGCNVKAGDGDSDLDIDEIDREQVEDTVRETAEELEDLEICPGFTLEELLQADALSEECREALLSFLPEPQTSFEGRLVAPGGLREASGELRVLLQGAGEDGAALSAEALASAEVYATLGGEERLLTEDEFSIALMAELPGELVAVSVVNDYSASMWERDIRDVAEVERELFACLPPVYEAQVLRFSEEVEVVLDFSADDDALQDAVAYDEGFDRGTTALLDAIGDATGNLSEHARPVRILLLSTDGGENASTRFGEPEVLDALDEAGVFVVVMGALLADVDFMRTLADGRGVYFYTREFSALQDAATPYLESLKQLVELRIAELEPPPSSVRIVLDDLELALP